MVSFQTKNPNLDKFWSALDWKMLIYFMAICSILRTFGIFYNQMVCTFCVHLVHFSGFGIMYQEKSGNPGLHWKTKTRSAAKTHQRQDKVIRKQF
jgi:hypothetical protein